MADIPVTVYDVGRATAANFTDNKTAAVAGNNYLIPNNGRVVVIAQPGAAANLTVTTPNTVDSNAIADLVMVNGDTDVRIWGPFPTAIYNNALGQVSIAVSANCDILAIRV